jgi:hypothetical protein
MIANVSLTAVDQLTSSTIPFTPRPGSFSVQLSGTWAGTVSLRRKASDESSYNVVEAFTGNCTIVVDEPEDYTLWDLYWTARTSGTVVCRLGQ